MRLTRARVDKVAALRAWLAEILGTKAVTIRIVATSRPERDIEYRMDNLGRSVKRVSIRARVLSKTFVHIRVSVYTMTRSFVNGKPKERYKMRSNHRCYVTRIACECEVKARKPSANLWGKGSVWLPAN